MKLAAHFFSIILIFIFTFNIYSQKKDSLIEIKVNVMVVDSKDQPINDLKQEDIKIFEDGKEQKINTFTKKEPVLNVGLIIDNTGSMRIQIEQIIWTGKMISDNLSSNDNEFIVRFVSSDKIQLIQDWILPQGSRQNQAKVQTVLDNLFVEGGQSAVIDAIHFSAKKIIERQTTNKNERYALVLLSDGEDRDSLHKDTELIELLKSNNIEFYSIAFIGGSSHVISLSPSSNLQDRIKKYLNNISNETGGASFFLNKEPPTQEMLTQALKKLIYELRSQFIIGYTSTNQKRDGKSRKLTVQIADSEKGEKRQAFIREGFTVPKN